MAAMRLALMGLCRRSSAAASMSGGRTAGRNLEGWRRFSTEGMKGANQDKPLLEHKAESILYTWWQRSRDYVKKDMQGNRFILLYTGSATTLCYVFYCVRAVHLSTFGKCTKKHSTMPMVPFVCGLYLP